MRSIKFRAWDKKYEVMREVMSIDFAFPQIDEGGTTYPMENIILMQYTGLKDKSNKEIYEGDIVKNHRGVLGDIYFADGAFCIRWNFEDIKNHQYHALIYSTAGSFLEIIGNIYENPEILRGAK